MNPTPLPDFETTTLFTAPLSMFGMKVEIALREKGVSFQRVSVPYNASTGYSPKHPEVLRVNPKRQVSVLLNGNVSLFDSTQIFEYLEDVLPTPAFWPRDVGSRAKCRQLELMADEVYFPHIIRLMGLQNELGGSEAQAAISAAEDYYQRMENTIGDDQFLCGDFSFADIAFFMAQLFGERMGAPMTQSTVRLLSWRSRIANRKSVRETLAPMVLFLHQANRPVPDYIVVSTSI